MNTLPVRPRGPIPLFVGGIWYSQISHVADPSNGGGISAVSIWKALKKSKGFPVIVRNALVATEHWVTDRRFMTRRNYPL